MNNLLHIALLLQTTVVTANAYLSFLISKRLKSPEFKYLGLAWITNCLYILISYILEVRDVNIVPELLKNISYYNFDPVKYSELIIISILDFFNTLLISIAIWPIIKKYVIIFKKTPFLLFISILFIALLIKLIPNNPDTDFVKLIVVRNIPIVILNVLVLIILSMFYFELSEKYKSSILLPLSTLSFALLQILALFQEDSFEAQGAIYSNIEGFGFAFGFICKLLIFLGLINLLNSYERQKEFELRGELAIKFRHVIGRTFHEITPQLLIIETNLSILNRIFKKERLEYKSSKYGSKSELLDTLNSLNYTLSRARTIISALRDVYQSQYIYNEKSSKLKDAESPNVPEKEILNINTLIEKAIISFKSARYKDLSSNYFVNDEIKFTTEYAGNCNLYCLGQEIEQIVFNLILNSFESFYSVNSIDAVIETQTEQKCHIYIKTRNIKIAEKKYIQIIYEDNAKGIDSEYIDKIFQDGFSTKPMNKMNRGMGLGVIKFFVEEHYNGSINVYSPPSNDNEKNSTNFEIINTEEMSNTEPIAESNIGTRFKINLLKTF